MKSEKGGFVEPSKVTRRLRLAHEGLLAVGWLIVIDRAVPGRAYPEAFLIWVPTVSFVASTICGMAMLYSQLRETDRLRPRPWITYFAAVVGTALMAAAILHDVAGRRILAAGALATIPVVLFFVPWLYARFRSGRGTPLFLDIAFAALVAGLADRALMQMRHGDLRTSPIAFVIDPRFLLLAGPISIALCPVLMPLLRRRRWGRAVAALIGVGIAVALAQWWDPFVFKN